MAGALLGPLTAKATAFNFAGNICWEATGLLLPGITIRVTGDGFIGSGTSDAAGFYDIVLPVAGGEFTATALVDADETVISPGGGARISLFIDGTYAEHTRRHDFGGTVYPGCSPTSGDGNLQLHISSGDEGPLTAPVGDGVAQRQLTTVSNEFWFATAPKPVTSLAGIKFGTPRDGRVSFRVFHVSGRMVREISDGMARTQRIVVP